MLQNTKKNLKKEKTPLKHAKSGTKVPPVYFIALSKVSTICAISSSFTAL